MGPMPPNLPPPPPQVAVQVGDIAVTPTEVITPAGRRPLVGTTWIVTNNTSTTQAIPTWAIVMCILFVLACLLGLLFLLAKEERTTGYVVVSVQADGFFYATHIPVNSLAQLGDIDARVNAIRAMAAQAR